MGGGDQEGLFQMRRVKGHREMIYRTQSHQIGVGNCGSESETVVLCELSLHCEI